MTHTILDFRFWILDWGMPEQFIGREIEIMPGQPQMMPTLLSHSGTASSPALCYPFMMPQPAQDPLKHLLIGSPRAIHHTIHLLHNLGYAEAGLWSPLMAIPQQQLVMTPNAGEMMSLLMRYIRFE